MSIRGGDDYTKNGMFIQWNTMQLLNGVSRSVGTEGESFPDIPWVEQMSQRQSADTPCDIIWCPWESLAYNQAALTEDPSCCIFKSTPVFESRSCSPWAAHLQWSGVGRINLFLEETRLLHWPTLFWDSSVAVLPSPTYPSFLSILGITLALWSDGLPRIPPNSTLFPSYVTPALYPLIQGPPLLKIVHT